jgi:hypothetical protein
VKNFCYLLYLFQIKLWYIPDGGLATHLSEWLIDLHGHKRRVGYIEWHPTAENILVSAGFDHLVSKIVRISVMMEIL